MKLHLCGASLAFLFLALPAEAASLCNCCGVSTAQSCAAACTAVKPPDNQCQATVDYEGKTDVGPGVNPLYGISLRNMSLGHPNAAELEQFRSLLERSRDSAEMDRRSAWRDFDQRKIDATRLADVRKRYDAAMVNYFLGLSAFRKAQSGP